MSIGQSVGGIAAGVFESQQAAQAAADLERRDNKLKYDPRNYDAVQYAGDVAPEMYGTPEAAQYQTVAEDPRTRDYQMQALARMQGLADQAAGSQEALGRYNAVSDGNALAAQREAGIRNQMAMRGQGGSAMDFVLQAQGGQMGANRAQAAGLQAAQQAALQRLQGTQGVMAGASNVRGMDASVAGQNADIINKFNMYNTGNRNAANMGNVDMKNSAQLRNTNAKQGIMQGKATASNQSLDRNDRNIGNQHDADMGKFAMQNQLGQNYARAVGGALKSGGDLGDDLLGAASAGMKMGG